VLVAGDEEHTTAPCSDLVDSLHELWIVRVVGKAVIGSSLVGRFLGEELARHDDAVVAVLCHALGPCLELPERVAH